MNILNALNPTAKSAKPEDFVDNRFIKELDDGGFIDINTKANRDELSKDVLNLTDLRCSNLNFRTH